MRRSDGDHSMTPTVYPLLRINQELHWSFMVLVFLCVRPVRGRSGAYRVCGEPARYPAASYSTRFAPTKAHRTSSTLKTRPLGLAFVKG